MLSLVHIETGKASRHDKKATGKSANRHSHRHRFTLPEPKLHIEKGPAPVGPSVCLFVSVQKINFGQLEQAGQTGKQARQKCKKAAM